MSEKVTLNRISTLRAHHVIAVVAVLLISFGVKMFFLSSAPTAEANIRASRMPA